MSKGTLPSLEQLIRQRIRHRIVLAMLILVSAASLLTGVEVAMSVSKRIDKLKERASLLQDLVTSEVLVHNTAAVEAILTDANTQHPDEIVHWISPDAPATIQQESLEWQPSGQWVFKTPLRPWGDQKFGAFIFTGNLLMEDGLISVLTYRALYVIVFCVVLCVVLLPIAKKAPNELILKPVRRLLSLVSAERVEHVALESHEFSEIKDLEDELKSLLMERRLREDEQIEIEQNKALTQAAQMLAHDIRRPFALVKAALDGMAEARTPESAQRLAKMTLPRVTSAFSTLDAMLDELMMLGRPQVIPAVRVDMRRIIEQVVETSLVIHPGFEARVLVDLEDGLCVKGHADHLQRVISNLIANALQAMSQVDTLHVSGRREGNVVKIRVKNTGSYIPLEDRASIFKLFYTKGKVSGSGLGLAICKRIISAHKGMIAVESSLENGTAFVISLPVAAAIDDSSDNAKRLAATAQRGVRRLLIADDELFFRETLENTAYELDGDIEVIAAKTAEEAIRLAMAENFDAIVIDVNFGNGQMDGIAAVRLMRCENIKSKICVHTNDSSHVTLDHAMRAGADVFVPKPMTKNALRNVLS